MTSPSVVRSLVTRRVTSSTVPSAGGVAGDGQVHHVAVAVLLLGNDEEARQDVLHDALRAETEGCTDHGGRSGEPAERDPEHAQDVDDDDDRNADDQRPRHHIDQRPTVFGVLRLDDEVAGGEARLDPRGISAGEPPDDAGQQDRTQDPDHDLESVGGQPDIDPADEEFGRGRPGGQQRGSRLHGHASADAIRQRMPASMNLSSSPSSTAVGLLSSTPVRRSLTIWYGCST